MANHWFKFYGQDFLADMKMGQLSVTERLFWVTLMCLAHEDGRGGEIRYCTEPLVKQKMGLQESDREWKELDGVFELFKKMEMIDFTKNGIFLRNFSKRQESNFTPAEKMARVRARKKLHGNESYQGVVTNVDVDKTRQDKTRPEKRNTGARAARRVEDASKFSKLGADLIKEFESVDPKNKKNYANKTQRKACDFLLEEYGLEEVLKRVRVLPTTNKVPYFPKIYTPYDLQEKWGKLQDAVEQERAKKKSGSNFIL